MILHSNAENVLILSLNFNQIKEAKCPQIHNRVDQITIKHPDPEIRRCILGKLLAKDPRYGVVGYRLQISPQVATVYCPSVIPNVSLVFPKSFGLDSKS